MFNMQIKITYYGHSCFKIAYHSDSVLTDPYDNGSVPGYTLPAVSAARVFCSHGHADHNAAYLVDKEEGNGIIRAETMEVPHDDADGAKRGMCNVTFFTAGKCRIVHMGDIGRLPAEKEYEKLQGTDVMLIPCGGYFTIDARQAAEIVDTVKPKLTILMHYRDGSRGYDVTADIQDIVKAFRHVERRPETSVIFDEDDIPSGIITLNPVQ